MSRPFQLYRLQQIDTQLDSLRRRLSEVENALVDDSRDLQAAEKVALLETELHQANKMLVSAEDETQKLRIKLELTEAALYGGKVRNPKELQDLQSESAALKRQMSILEDRQLEKMMAEEQAVEQLEAGRKEQKRINEEELLRVQALNQEKARITRDLASSEDERSATIGSIEAGDLEIYNRLRQKRRGIAVSKVEQKACSACGTTLNATLLDAARSPNQINLCDNCGRILYVG